VKKWQIAVVAVVVVAVAVGGFFGGRVSAGSKTPTVQEAMQVLQNQSQQGGGNGYGFPGGANGANGTLRRGGAVSGSIIATDSSSITVKTTDGSTKIVLVSSSTTVSKVSQGSLSDLTTGQEVVVTGTTNSDGSVSATRIQLGTGVSATTGAGGPAGGAGVPPAGAPGGTNGVSGAAPGAAGQNIPAGGAGTTNSTAPAAGSST
jgi:hypothetical protein